MSANDARVRLEDLAIESIRPNDKNPRLVFPQEELDRLAESIDLEGILVPIVVYPKDDYFVLVDGERRFRCAQTLGLETVPAVITSERSEHEVLLQMFNIHLIREPWKDMPTAKAVGRLITELESTGEDASDVKIRDLTGLSIERVRQLRYVNTLPPEWQGYIERGEIPLNYFWEIKRNVLDLLKTKRPELLNELGSENIAQALVTKRLEGIITDTVSVRKIRPVINFAAEEASEEEGKSDIDDAIRSLVGDPLVSIEDVYEDTVQSMVEADKLERRTRSMLASFQRLFQKARTDEETAELTRIGSTFVTDLQELLRLHDVAGT